jgi:hypothetical protein
MLRVYRYTVWKVDTLPLKTTDTQNSDNKKISINNRGSFFVWMCTVTAQAHSRLENIFVALNGKPEGGCEGRNM